MKTGNLSNLVAMATELQRRAEAKKDFIAPTQKLAVTRMDGVEIGKPHTIVVGDQYLTMTDHFRRQVAANYRVPFEYAERIREAHPDLYVSTLNTFFNREPATRMIRTMDGKARAFLSDRYRPLDNHDLMDAALPALLEHDHIEIKSMDVSDNKFYLKAVFPKLEAKVVGDVVQMGLVISNSEVGAGTLSVLPMVYTLRCLNGMIMPSDGMKRTHLGKRNEAEDGVTEFLSDQTRRLDDAAFFAKVRDVVKGQLSDLVLNRLTAKLRESAEQKLDPAKLNEIVDVTAVKFGYNETTRNGILAHLIRDGGTVGLTRYGLMNAVTRQSQDEEDYELATQMEADGGRIIQLERNDWKQIAEAA